MTPPQQAPSPQDALSRLQVLLGVMGHLGAHEDPAGSPEDLFATRGELQERGYWQHASPWEQEMLARGKGEFTKLELIHLSWMPEGIHVFAWALQFVEDLAPWNEVAPIEPLLELNPDLLANPDLQPVLRPQDELESAREIAERWHWRARTRDLQRKSERPFNDPDHPEHGVTFDELIRRAAQSTAPKAGFVPIDGDFPVQGMAYRDVPDEMFFDITSAAIERHRALNWLCGHAPGNRWGETPTDS